MTMPVFASGDKVLIQSPTSNKNGETAVIQHRCKGLGGNIYHVQFADGTCRSFRADSLRAI